MLTNSSPVSPRLKPQPLAKYRLLIVDDWEPWRRRICSMLRERPELQVIHEASDGLEAVQAAQELRPDLILLDIGLPRLNGLDAARRIRQVAPDAKILFLSQTHDADTIRAAISNGAGGFVAKADAGRQLLPAIESVLRDQKFAGEATVVP